MRRSRVCARSSRVKSRVDELRAVEKRAESAGHVAEAAFALLFLFGLVGGVFLGILDDPLWFLLFPASLVLASIPMAIMSERSDRARRRREAAEAWGAPRERDRDLGALRAFPGFCVSIDDQTWADLEMHSAFGFLDRTCSAPGEAVLCSWLSCPEVDPGTLADRDRLADHFVSNVGDRERLAATLSPIGYRGAGGAIDLLWREVPDLPWYTPLLGPLSLVPFFGLAALLLWGAHGVVYVFVPLFVVNLFIHMGVSHRLHGYRDAVISLARMAHATRRVAALPMPAIRTSQAELRALLPAVRAVAESGKALLLDLGDRGEILAALFEYLGVLFLVVARGFVRTLRVLEERREELQRAFTVLGELDAVYSIASLRAGLPVWCRPERGEDDAELVVEGIRHPQIEDAVPNSLRLGARGALITGVNMSGKSTLLRTVGLGAIMAQSLATVPAERWSGPRLRILTSISHRDRMLEGKSFFLVEAERMLELLRGATGDGRALVLVDELLRGTNSSERIGASVALLRSIAVGGAITLVATHELELAERLGDRFDALHFEEEVGHGALAFTYRLAPGTATTRNALRLLSELGLPDPLVEEATRIARECDERRS